LFEAAHSFRVRQKVYTAGGGKKKGGKGGGAPLKATRGTIWVAKEYPPWQSTILAHLASEYKDGKVPENKKLAADFARMPELKKYQKKVMPFVQTIKERIESVGIQRGTQQTSDFDEIEVLNNNIAYLRSSLDVKIFIKSSHN
jgi:leucyl-tRNA synthetase